MMTLYQAHVEKFSRRVFKLFYPYLIIYGLLLFLPFLNAKGDNLIIAIWTVLILLIIVLMLESSYKWAFNQVKSLSFNNDIFQIEVLSKDIKQIYTIHKDDIKTNLKWQGGRPRILKLSLFDKDVNVAAFIPVENKKRN